MFDVRTGWLNLHGLISTPVVYHFLSHGKHSFHLVWISCSAGLTSGPHLWSDRDRSRCNTEIEKTEISAYSPINTAAIICASTALPHKDTQTELGKTDMKPIRPWSGANRGVECVFFSFSCARKHAHTSHSHCSLSVCWAVIFSQGQPASELWKIWMKVHIRKSVPVDHIYVWYALSLVPRSSVFTHPIAPLGPPLVRGARGWGGLTDQFPISPQPARP